MYRLNKEGNLLGLEGNRRLGGDILAGVFCVVGGDECGHFGSLTEVRPERYSTCEEYFIWYVICKNNYIYACLCGNFNVKLTINGGPCT